MSDEALLLEWYAARGKNCPPLKKHEEAAILRSLRVRQSDIDNPKPLIYCPVCQTKCRGEHNGLQRQIAA